ncbi:hypothetical protein HAZT_HAZT002619 [Hyalella azteca]|uniref:ubiquitinyl hydrolase 1 n=1 Tax=Hyalella azteca TaxID=294128 RepID=A0A6A0GZR8_HYAAZ|nr:hypothetical protein HAZT_HAZT002619 [Hyalella azteca]
MCDPMGVGRKAEAGRSCGYIKREGRRGLDKSEAHASSAAGLVCAGGAREEGHAGLVDSSSTNSLVGSATTSTSTSLPLPRTSASAAAPSPLLSTPPISSMSDTSSIHQHPLPRYPHQPMLNRTSFVPNNLLGPNNRHHEPPQVQTNQNPGANAMVHVNNSFVNLSLFNSPGSYTGVAQASPLANPGAMMQQPGMSLHHAVPMPGSNYPFGMSYVQPQHEPHYPSPGAHSRQPHGAKASRDAALSATRAMTRGRGLPSHRGETGAQRLPRRSEGDRSSIGSGVDRNSINEEMCDFNESDFSSNAPGNDRDVHGARRMITDSQNINNASLNVFEGAPIFMTPTIPYQPRNDGYVYSNMLPFNVVAIAPGVPMGISNVPQVDDTARDSGCSSPSSPVCSVNFTSATSDTLELSSNTASYVVTTAGDSQNEAVPVDSVLNFGEIPEKNLDRLAPMHSNEVKQGGVTAEKSSGGITSPSLASGSKTSPMLENSSVKSSELLSSDKKLVSSPHATSISADASPCSAEVTSVVATAVMSEALSSESAPTVMHVHAGTAEKPPLPSANKKQTQKQEQQPRQKQPPQQQQNQPHQLEQPQQQEQQRERIQQEQRLQQQQQQQQVQEEDQQRTVVSESSHLSSAANANEPAAPSAWGKSKNWEATFKGNMSGRTVKTAVIHPIMRNGALELEDEQTPSSRPAPAATCSAIVVAGPASTAASELLDNTVSLPPPVDDTAIKMDKTKIGDFLSEYKADSSNVMLQPRGLTNKNYWCYSNTVLQSLTAVPQFVNLYSEMQQRVGSLITPHTMPISHSIITYLNEFRPMNTSAVNLNVRARKKAGQNVVNLPELQSGDPFEPSSVQKMLLQKTGAQFQEGYQQDAEEMLSFLLNASHDEFNECIKLAALEKEKLSGQKIPSAVVLPNGQADDNNDDWVTMGPKNKACITRTTQFSHSPISEIFWGESRAIIKKGNSPVTNNLEPFITLPLDIQDEAVTSVKEALNQFVSKADVAGYTCTDTQEELAVSSHYLLEQLPQVLILQLKRFVYSKDGGLQKVTKDISLSIDLEISKDLISPQKRKKLSGEQTKYKLVSVIYHDGKDANKGHYVCNVYHPGYHCWLHYDDSCVKPIVSAELQRFYAPRVPYILFYRRVDTFAEGTAPSAIQLLPNRRRINKDKRNSSSEKASSTERHEELGDKPAAEDRQLFSANNSRKSSLDGKPTSVERKSIENAQSLSQLKSNNNKRQEKKQFKGKQGVSK